MKMPTTAIATPQGNVDTLEALEGNLLDSAIRPIQLDIKFANAAHAVMATHNIVNALELARMS